jgi:uncharacterized OB-fold protein
MEDQTMQKPLADVFSWPDDNPQLIGSRCDDCGAATFPVQSRCPRCGQATMSELKLPRRGTLVAWTTQGFVPKLPYADLTDPKEFIPFGVGLVQLDDIVRVESRLTESDPGKLQFGMPVDLEIIPFYVDANGDEIMTFAFAPAADSNDRSAV